MEALQTHGVTLHTREHHHRISGDENGKVRELNIKGRGLSTGVSRVISPLSDLHSVLKLITPSHCRVVARLAPSPPPNKYFGNDHNQESSFIQ